MKREKEETTHEIGAEESIDLLKKNKGRDEAEILTIDQGIQKRNKCSTNSSYSKPNDDSKRANEVCNDDRTC